MSKKMDRQVERIHARDKLLSDAVDLGQAYAQSLGLPEPVAITSHVTAVELSTGLRDAMYVTLVYNLEQKAVDAVIGRWCKVTEPDHLGVPLAFGPYVRVTHYVVPGQQRIDARIIVNSRRGAPGVTRVILRTLMPHDPNNVRQAPYSV